MASFCGIQLPAQSKGNLTQLINNLDNNSKASLQFLYSEYLIRANFNSDYRQILKESEITAIDGRGLEWTNQVLQNQKIIQIKNKPFRFLVLLKVLITNVLTGFLVILFKKNISDTSNQIILGRDYIYDLFDIAHQKSWRVAIIGGSQKLQDSLSKKYSDLNFKFWWAEPNSNLMRDIPAITKLKINNFRQIHSFLNSDNLYYEFPELENAKTWLKENPADLVIIALGGASGKQELLAQDLKHFTEIKFALITGIGAGLDHLGAGKEQKRVPGTIENLGLEAFYRLITNPKRRVRIWDSLFTLWWWTSLQPFVTFEKQVSWKNFWE